MAQFETTPSKVSQYTKNKMDKLTTFNHQIPKHKKLFMTKTVA